MTLRLPRGVLVPGLTALVAVGAGAPAPKPDLRIKAFGFLGPREGLGTCAPGSAVYTFQVIVENAGAAPSPALPGRPLVLVTSLDRPGWEGRAELPSIPPHGSQTVSVSIPYLEADPAYMVQRVPHRFRAVADPLKLVDEADETNNESAEVRIGAPANCDRLNPKK